LAAPRVAPRSRVDADSDGERARLARVSDELPQDVRVLQIQAGSAEGTHTSARLISLTASSATRFVHWNDKVQEFMNAHLLHVGMGRMDSEIINDGRNDKQYFADFEGAWQTLMKSLKPQHREIFRDEIDFRLQDREFQFCGTLGKEFIPL
jgi:hypothetical protein